MRSLLIQASSVEKAVEKAWTSAGMPTEFTIKVLDFGEKGFLGITKKAAIVSIIYEPKKQTAVSQQKPQKPQRVQKKYPKKDIKQERRFWSKQMIDDITSWIKDVSHIMGITKSINVQVHKKILTLTFNDFVMSSQDEERLLFSGISYLAMQFLKKKHKKKYLGYQLIFASKRFTKKGPGP